MKTAIGLCSILLCGFVTACDNGDSQTPASTISVTADGMSQYSSETTVTPVATEPFLTGKLFPDTHDFLIHQFQVNYDAADQAVIYSIDYSFGKTPLNYLISGKHKFYFELEIPSRLATYFTDSATKLAEGPPVVNTDENLQYQVQWSAKLNKNITQSEIHKILHELEQYSLILYENKDDPAKKVVGVEEFSETQ